MKLTKSFGIFKKKIKLGDILKVLMSTLFSFLLIAYLLSQINWETLGKLFKNMSISWIIISFIIFIFIIFLRSYRFYYLLSSHVSLKKLFHITASYNLLNNTLPFKMGEFSYIYFLKKKTKIPISAGIYSLFVSRVFDVFTISAIFFLSILFYPKIIAHYGFLVLCVGIILISVFLIFIFVLFKGPFLAKIAFQYFTKLKVIKFKLISLILYKIEEFNNNLSKIKSSRQYTSVIVISSMIWIFQIFFVFSLFNILHIDLNLIEIILSLVFISGVFILPLPNIMNLGTYEAAIVLAFTSFGIPLDIAISYSVILHTIYVLFFGTIGLYGFFRLYIALY